MKRVTLRYGVDTIDKDVPESTTIGQLVGDPNIRAVLGFGDNVKALVSGVEIPNEALAPGGTTVVIETRANTKAAH